MFAKLKFQVSDSYRWRIFNDMGSSRGVRFTGYTLRVTSGSSQHCCCRGVGPVRNRKVAPGSAGSMVLATSVPSRPVTQRKLSAGRHPGEVHVETRPVTTVARCPSVTEWSVASLTLPRRHMASGVTVEKTCSRRIQP